MVKKFVLDDYKYEVEIGKMAAQADGAVWFRQGGTVLLATAVSAPSQDFPGFLPLTIDYRELFSAAGKIPGGYYKREGKSTDKEVLTGRLIDRALRPLFPANYFNQVQVLITVYSVDKEHAPGNLALIASSLALVISKIPFLEPVASVEIGRVDGKWVINPLYAESLQSDVRIVVAGTKDGLCMVEGCTNEISEDQLLEVLFMAHERIKSIIAWQERIRQDITTIKEPIADSYQINLWQERTDAFFTLDVVKQIYIADKVERNAHLDQLRTQFTTQYQSDIETLKVPTKVIDYVLDQTLQRKITEMMFQVNHRIDGRPFEKIRNISVEVGLLPNVHGSALFTRGRTQALASVTLGGGQDEQKEESVMEDEPVSKAFMLHYNFPPFSSGEVRPMRGPGRREVGHGYLAASALKYVLPAKKEFPYTIRVVVDILESDGSTSMATTCSATMALMQAGVPIKKMVSGIAMGLIKNQSGNFKVLSDISGFEDAFGLMDLKVTGTADGITALQMDVKYKGGLTRDIFKTAFAQAREGRLHILGEMQKVMSKPNPELSPLVPRLIVFNIDTDKIGAIIGSGGKTIREITEKTKTSIDIEPDGLVKIFGGTDANIDLAVGWVKVLAGQIYPGTRYQGKVKRLADFGIFVELVPGQDGLVHISYIPREKQRTFMTDYKPDTIVTVEVVEYDPETGRIRLKLV